MNDVFRLAESIKKQGKQTGGGYQIGTVAQVIPELVVSTYGGAVMLRVSDGNLRFTETLRNKTLHCGETLVLIGSQRFLAIDRI